MTEAVIASYARTPIGKAYRGSLNATHGATLGAHAVAAAVTRAAVEPSEVQDVIVGASLGEGTTGANIARQVALRAGLPVSTPGVTINRFCSSGLQTIALAAQRVMTGEVDMLVAGGLESISLVQNEHMNTYMAEDPWLLEHKPEIFMTMLATAEIVAERYGIDRERQDAFALRSQLRTATAQEAGALRRRDRAHLDPAPRRRSRHRRGASRAGDAAAPTNATGRGRRPRGSPRFHR